MNDCKQCKESVVDIYGDVGCKLLSDWLTRQEYKEKEMNYCINCMNSIIKFTGNGYICYCAKKKKEVGFYDKCKGYK